DAGKVQKLKGFGPKIEEKMRAGLGQAQVTERRMLLSEAETQANAIVTHVKEGGGVRQIEVAGSYRRRRETIGDLDILVTAGETEAQIYDALGLDWIPPELREARGEIALAREHRLPKLVELADVRGDLQMHTSATDGRGTIAEMADAARALQYEYIAITDHSKRVTMALGLDAKRLREQWPTIDEWNASARGFTILKSVERDTLETGKPDP